MYRKRDKITYTEITLFFTKNYFHITTKFPSLQDLHDIGEPSCHLVRVGHAVAQLS